MSAAEMVTVSCPKCHVPMLTLPEQNGLRQCDKCSAYFEIRTFPSDQEPSGVVWATAERKLPPIPEPSFPAVVDSPSIADPSFATAGEALKAARDEHSDELAAHVPPKYHRQSKLRHWWESKKGEWRQKLRAWLGIDDLQRDIGVDMRAQGLDEVAYRQATEATLTKLRSEFDDATQANVDIFRNYDHRITGTQQNISALQQLTHNQGRMLAAFRTVPMNGVAWRKFVDQERINAERKQRKVAGSIAPAEPVTAASPEPEVVAIEHVADVPHSD